MSSLLNDIKYAFRQLRKSPGFTIVAVLSLALGIGANTAIFSIINGVLFKPLPVHNPEELRVINWAGSGIQLPSYDGSGKDLRNGLKCRSALTYPIFCRLRDQADEFSEVFAYHPLNHVTTLVGNTATTSDVMMVSCNFFSGYGMSPFLGRSLVSEDERQEATPVAVITYRFWKKHLGLDPRVLGRTVSLNKLVFTVVGVLPQRYVGPLPGDPTDVYVPLATTATRAGLSLSPNGWWIKVMARLKPEANIAQAQAACDVIFRQALQGSKARVENPVILLEDGSRGPLINRQDMAQPFWILLGAGGLVMLIACANIAGMLLSRGSTRHHEMAVRAAIGARRGHLLRQSLLESFLLSGLAIGLGLMLSIVIRQNLAGFLMNAYDCYNLDLHIDTTVLFFTAGLSLATTLLFGLLPAWRISGVNPVSGMGSARVHGGGRTRLGSILVAAQMGLSLFLIVFAGLLVRTLLNLKHTNPGFDTEKLLVFYVDAHEAGYDEEARADFYEQLRDSVAGLPGVENVTFANFALLHDYWDRKGFSISGRQRPPDQEWTAPFLYVGKDYFITLGIPLLQGRAFNNGDTKTTPRAVIINECFARTYFPGENPMGQRLDDCQIVGVCRDTKYLSVRSRVYPIMYFPHSQNPMEGAFITARTVLPPLSLSTGVQKIVSALDKTIPIKAITSQTLIIEDTLMIEHLAALLCIFLAILGLLLAAIGLYGLISYAITRRTLEIGLRMALGACPGDIAHSILRQAFFLSLAGITIGLPVALLGARVLRSIVYGVETYDPITLMIGAGILFAVTVLAAWIPVRRATHIDPMEALRYE